MSSLKKYLIDHLNKMESILKEPSENIDISKIKKEHLIQIQFLQHERLIHFFVTFLFAILFVISIFVFLITENIFILPLIILFIGLLIPYIWYYYFLENNVQKLYFIYNDLCTKEENLISKDKVNEK